MRTYILSRPAADDIEEILEYVAEQSPQTALALARQFEQMFEKIADMPGIGHRREELRDHSLRVVNVSGFLVIYDAVLSPVHILHVVRGARDLSQLSAR